MKTKKEKHLNKKGFSMISEADSILFWFIVVGVIALCAILIVAWTSAIKKMYLDDSLQPMAYEARLIYSEKCFAYQEPETGRVYTGTIDINKFNNKKLYECLPLTGMANHAISVTLEYKDKDLNQQEGRSLYSQNWEMKSEEIDEIIANTYIINVEGQGPGRIIFMHKLGN